MKVNVLVSHSARITKSMRGSIALIAKTRVKVEDDEHESDIKKGEKFYLKKLGSRFYLMDKEGKDYYQFGIDKKKYDQLMKKHEVVSETESKPKVGPKAKKAGKRTTTVRNNGGKIKDSKEVQDAIKSVHEKRKLAKDKDVLKYQELIKRSDYLKGASTWDDPDKRQIAKEKAANDKALALLEQNAKVNKFKSMKHENDIMGSVLDGLDPDYTKASKTLNTSKNAGARTRALNKLHAIVKDYLK